MLKTAPLCTEPGYCRDENVQMVLCPECGSNFTHIEEVRVLQKNRTDTVGVGGHVEGPGESRPDRGSAVEVRMWCESGHSFSIWLSFHKGNTTMFASPRGEHPEEHPSELWRD